MGHGGVYKVDGHGRPEPSVGEENSTFLPCHGARSPRPPLDFLSHWATPGDYRAQNVPAKWDYEYIRRSQPDPQQRPYVQPETMSRQ